MSTVINKVHHPLHAELAAIVGPTYTSDEDFVRLTYSGDTSPVPGKVQGIVVRPANTEQVSEIVKLANLTRTPVIPSGGRASLLGAPPGLPGRGIVIDMTRMRKILSIDEVNTAVTVEAGITTAEMTAKCNERGWHVHTAYQPYYTDTVGGQISGVMGAGAGLDYTSAGWNTHHLCGIKLVLPDGSVLQTGSGPGTNVNLKDTFARDLGSPDITGMFVGDAGIFGIKVEATYRMYRPAKIREGRACYFDTFDDAWRWCMDLSAVEPLTCCCIAIIVPTHTTRAMGAQDKWLGIVIVKSDRQKEIESKFDIVGDCMRKVGGQWGEDPASIDWAHQVAVGTQYREMGALGSLGAWTLFEILASRSELPKCLFWVRDYVQGRLERNDIDYDLTFSASAMGTNQWVVSAIIFVKKSWDPKVRAAMRDLFHEGHEMAAAQGWNPDSHHGYGTTVMAKYWSPPLANFMRTLKRAIDPNNIMNPGLWDL